MRNTRRSNGLYYLVTLCAGVFISSNAPCQSLIWLGTLGGDSSYANAVSDNAVVVGRAKNGSGINRAFRWQYGLMHDLGTVGGSRSEALDVSADGTVIVGTSQTASGQNCAFYWNSGTIQCITPSIANTSTAFGVSADGRVVVGLHDGNAFRWRQTTQQIEILSRNGEACAAADVSADGQSIAVYCIAHDDTINSYRYTDSWGEPLGMLGGNICWASAISGNGEVIVGMATTSLENWQAFAWQNGSLRNLGTLDGIASWALGVDFTGNRVVGWAHDADNQQRAFLRQNEAIYDLNLLYANLLTDGSTLKVARAISPNGRFIVGVGYNASTSREEAYLLDTWRTGDTNGDGCVDDADLLALIMVYGDVAPQNEDINLDGVVDDSDLLIVLFAFGRGC